MIGPMPGTSSPARAHVLTSQPLDLAGEAFDRLIEAASPAQVRSLHADQGWRQIPEPSFNLVTTFTAARPHRSSPNEMSCRYQCRSQRSKSWVCETWRAARGAGARPDHSGGKRCLLQCLRLGSQADSL